MADAAPSQANRKVLKVTKFAGAIVLVVGLVAAVSWFFTRPTNLEVGDCLPDLVKQAMADGVGRTKVSCGSGAAFKVVGVVENITHEAANKGSPCKGWPGSSTSFWVGDEGKPGRVLCVVDRAHAGGVGF